MFCDTFTPEQINNLPLTNTFVDDEGNEIFEVLATVYYNIDYNEELEDFQNENGDIELISDEIISSDTLFRNGFDFISINVINENGKKQEIYQRELA